MHQSDSEPLDGMDPVTAAAFDNEARKLGIDFITEKVLLSVEQAPEVAAETCASKTHSPPAVSFPDGLPKRFGPDWQRGVLSALVFAGDGSSRQAHGRHPTTDTSVAQTVALIGGTGSGKSLVARSISKQLGCPMYDFMSPAQLDELLSMRSHIFGPRSTVFYDEPKTEEEMKAVAEAVTKCHINTAHVVLLRDLNELERFAKHRIALRPHEACAVAVLDLERMTLSERAFFISPTKDESPLGTQPADEVRPRRRNRP